MFFHQQGAVLIFGVAKDFGAKGAVCFLQGFEGQACAGKALQDDGLPRPVCGQPYLTFLGVFQQADFLIGGLKVGCYGGVQFNHLAFVMEVG